MLLDLLHVTPQVIIYPKSAEVAHLNSVRPDEYTPLGSTFEIPLPLHAPVILAHRLVKYHTYPGSDTWNFSDLANESYRPSTGIRAADLAPCAHRDSYMHIVREWWQRKLYLTRREGAPTSLLDFLPCFLDLLLLDFRRMGIESTNMMRLLVRKDSVRQSGIRLCGHGVFRHR